MCIIHEILVSWERKNEWLNMIAITLMIDFFMKYIVDFFYERH